MHLMKEVFEMEEKIYTGKKNGMAMLLGCLALYAIAIAGIIITAISYDRVHIAHCVSIDGVMHCLCCNWLDSFPWT